ncbi:MAG: class I SAM-dependent methyltransferase [Asgard group archaeon]|nr:class I SAM-dependent methyltransferase [Asgard group archaeon]
MKIHFSFEERLFLDALFSLELYPENEKNKEKTPTSLEDINSRGKLLHKWTFENKSVESNLKDISELLIQKELLQKTTNGYLLTRLGKSKALEIRGKRIGKRFSDELTKVNNSPTHSLFCKRVFGKDLAQANMMDMFQLEKLLKIINLTSKNKVLDLGCGLGKISEYISDKTNAYVLGIDIASEVINLAKKRTQEKRHRLDYQIEDINNLTLPSKSFDTIIAIATLHYVIDIERTIQQLKEILKPTGQMGIFTFQYAFEKDNPDTLLPENTKLAQILKKNNLTFRTWDFTKREIDIRQKQLLIANELKEQFQKEGNIELCKDRIEECEIDLPRLLNGEKRRFLFHVQL